MGNCRKLLIFSYILALSVVLTTAQSEVNRKCKQPVKAGPCKVFVHRWYFDAREAKCKRFIYGGCDGNENRFETEKDCATSCRRCSVPIDLVFALDASGSVKRAGFEKIKVFTKTVISGFEFGPKDSHIGIMTFSEDADVRIRLTETFEKDELFRKIDNIDYAGFRTNTKDALDKASTEMFSMNGGARQGVSKVLILLTDGKCTLCGNQGVKSSASKLKTEGVTIFTIGVTDNVNKVELQQISSDPSEDHMFDVADFDHLKTIISSLSARTCKVKKGKCIKPVEGRRCNILERVNTCTNDDSCDGVKKCCNNGCAMSCTYPLLHCLTSIDIAFALDASSSVKKEDFAKMKNFAGYIADSFAVSQQEARFATLVYSREADVRFTFAKYDTADQVKNAIGSLPTLRDDTRIDKALKLAKSDLFSLNGKVRTRRPMVLIVFFDGDVSRGMRDLEEFAAPLKNYGVKIVAIGVGPEFNIYQVNKVASSASMIYNASNFNAMMPQLFSIAKETCNEKFGECTPDPDPIDDDKICSGVVNECENDFDCFGNSKCCKRGCKKTCVRPPNVCKRKMDIAFAINNNMEPTDFWATKYYINSVMEQFEIGDDKTHIALMTFGPDAKVVFDFNADQSSSEVVKDRITNLKHQKGKGSLSSLLALSCDSIFCKLGGTRDPYHKMMVIITGPLERSDNNILEERIKTLRSRGVDVLILGVGNVDATVLQKITADNQFAEDRVMLSRDFSGIIQYIRDIPDFGCGMAATSPVSLTDGGCQPKTCVKGLKGSRGRQGDVGQVGYPGQRGPQGPEGLRGPKGTRGRDGEGGVKGGRGDQGLRGLPGFTGYNGIPGVPGEVGRPGNDGECGLPGKSGEAGLPGVDGFLGPRGLRGPPGRKGEKGPRAVFDPSLNIFPGDNGGKGDDGKGGRKGIRGEDGPKGFDGNLGYAGENGAKGENGQMGDRGKFKTKKGDKGNPGDVGPVGQQEVKEGPASELGLTGVRGENGTKGRKGEKGYQGPHSGENGRKGEKGAQGPKGDNGYRGGEGKEGQYGERGVNGYKGDKGQIGHLGLAGFPGRKGGKGETGPEGYNGEKGDFGDEVRPITGTPGVSGKGGVKGFSGREGSVGRRGPKGVKGKQGVMKIGPTGDPGAIGNRGSRGNNGLSGMVGMEGQRGEKGAPGVSGARGDQGRHAKVIPGKVGMLGPPGSKGTGGPIGDTGPHGRKGAAVVMNCVESICPKGKKGQSGAPGNTGIPGEGGIMGSSGPKGHPYPPCPICPVGVQGVSGEPGNPGYPGQNGEKGFPGDIGNIGRKGWKGEGGPSGFPGIKGASGENGAEGTIGVGGDDSPGDVDRATKGFKGLRGSIGLIGSRGPKGAKGRKGIRGPAGAQGSRGTRGSKGTSGTTGIKGSNGRPGRPGPDGVEGETSPGNPGFPGALGRQGEQGGTGEKGPVGRKGEKGAAPSEAEIRAVRASSGFEYVGESGSRGKYGDVGINGYEGPPGPRGAKGVQGPQGIKGFGGIKGDKALKGFEGDQGDRGSSGLPGRNGKRGPPGESGKAGKRGTAPGGMKGTRGLPGIDGRPGPDGSFPRVGCIDFGDPTDLAFIMDSSKSVTNEDFERQKTFIKNFLKRFPIGPTQTQAGIIKYGRTATIEIRFNDYATAGEIENAIDKIEHSSATESRLDSALMAARDDLFTLSKGSRGQLANKALVVMGDGFISGGGKKAVQLQDNALQYAEDLKLEGVTVFALGVGAERNKHLLKLMVSDESYYLEIETYSDLLTKIYQVQNELEEKSCTYSGDPGQDGLPGEPGDDGDTGKTGRMGKSRQGADGAKGPKGYQGRTGEGESGSPGVRGVMGAIGERGYPGRNGKDAKGYRGDKGEQGGKAENIMGVKGAAGDSGIVGPQGPSSQSLCDFVLATDIIFVVDTSSSVGHDNFHKMKVFIQDIIKSFDVDNQLTRASVITYDEVASLEIPLYRHNSLNTLLENIDRLRYRNGQATRTDLALLMAMNSGFTEKNGAREGVNKVLVFLTDGQQSYAPDQVPVSQAVQPLIDAGVKRYAIGIGREIDTTELRTIAGDDIVYADDFDQLKLKINIQIGIIAKRGCRGEKGIAGEDGKTGRDGMSGPNGLPGRRGPPGEPGLVGLKGYKGAQGDGLGFGSNGEQGDIGGPGPGGLPGCAPGNEVSGLSVLTDLVFLIDASGSLRREGFNREKEFVKNVIDKMGKISYQGTHVGVIVYSDEANIRIKLNDHYSNEDIKQAIDNLPYDSQGTRIDLGLKEAKKMFGLNTNHGARGNSKKVLILLTDGQRTYVPRVTEPSVVAKGLIADGVDIFSVGIGPEIDRTELESFISKPQYLFLAEDIDTIVQELSGEITTALKCEGGPRGEIGEPGGEGAGGPPGADGAHGLAGRPGAKGEPGFGPRGEPGSPGPKIEDNKGIKGEQGFRGPAGPEGNRGKRGEKGYLGPRGLKGDTAEPGFVGNQGRPGSPGWPGLNGESIGSGNKGPRGSIGTKGRRGDRGDPGTLPLGNVLEDYRGDRGVQGDKGFQGIKGQSGHLLISAGPPGLKGPGGEKGDNGNIGSRGKQGEAGTPGFPGLRGDVGFQGDQGINGLKGGQGAQGPKGSRGFQGATRKGEPGEIGIPGPIGSIGLFGEKGIYGFIGMPGIKGEEGEAGFPGRDGNRDGIVSPPGARGPKGERGDVGHQGQKGERAPIREGDEFKGDKGERGETGATGVNGAPGEGISGSMGRQGRPGILGLKGLNGDSGLRGRKGGPGDVIGGSESGDIGNMGLIGRKGSRGEIGEKGKPGISGERGIQGKKGRSGSNGFNGLRGDQGTSGGLGDQGPKGREGPKGKPGLPGPPGPSGIAEGFYIVRHSQDPYVPQCPRTYKKLWDGYSLMYTVGNGKSHSQDLGDPGSCSKSFSTMPFIFCDISGSCKYASRNDFVYWLSSRDVTQPMMPVSNAAIEPFISRCVVCEAPSIHIAVHSQDLARPDCPRGWESLWHGFSFMMVAGAGKTGAGQSLSSSGSCLETFLPKPFIECQGARGTCHFFSDKYSFWLTTIDVRTQFETQQPQTLIKDKGHDLKSRVSRCRVCVRSKGGRADGPDGSNFLSRFRKSIDKIFGTD